ncbi:hypothetical protein PTH_0400 [Pelotomaculum thermopropionicum SI]|uniref:Uncharacterized protein n=1 Tax=Pelotomaculum thermopropionicum (strain DSM 13744 / JCM 10971 / SI) TaxID=370438 RepID=A5D591_PELTS|nr:hypothetical protein PTH_0400 [Pelotomaculum thermopropionicum SI]
MRLPFSLQKPVNAVPDDGPRFFNGACNLWLYYTISGGEFPFFNLRETPQGFFTAVQILRNPSGVPASHRATSTGWVLKTRTRPPPQAAKAPEQRPKPNTRYVIYIIRRLFNNIKMIHLLNNTFDIKVTENRPLSLVLKFPLKGPHCRVLPQRFLHDAANAVQSFLCFSLAAGHQHRLGVGGPHQAPAVAEQHPGAVHVYHFIALPEMLHQPGHDAKLLPVGAGHPGLRRGIILRHALQQPGEGLFRAGQDAQQAPGGVKGVVVPEVLIGKEHVPRHFAGEHRPHFLHFGLDQGVAGLVKKRPASQPGHLVHQRLGALHLYDRRRPGKTRQYFPPVQAHQPVAPDDIPFFIHHTDAVGVAVVGHPQVGTAFQHGLP